MTWDVSDLAEPRQLSILTGHSGGVESVAVGPDGRTAMTGGGDAAILWDVSDLVKPHRMGRTVVGHAGLLSLTRVRAPLRGDGRGGAMSASGSPAGRPAAAPGPVWTRSAHADDRRYGVLSHQ